MASPFKDFLPPNSWVMKRASRKQAAVPVSDFSGDSGTETPGEKLIATPATSAEDTSIAVPLVSCEPMPLVPVAPVSAREPLPEGVDSLAHVAQELEGCQRCKLGRTRKNLVLGEGNPNARILFVGEGPGEQEDLQGRPFVGPAGQLLDKIIEAMGLSRTDIFIANVVKCRPPGNRLPEPDEIATCSPFLLRQIAAVKPEVVVSLGKCATQTLLKSEAAISKIRGKFQTLFLTPTESAQNGIPLMPTFHPSYLLRNPSAKKDVWEDMKQVAQKIGLKLPKK